MSDQIVFNEGKDALIGGGLTSTVSLALSTKKVGTQQAGEHQVGDTYAGGFGELTGTGYARKTGARPSSADGIVAFSLQAWTTGANADWGSPKSVVLIDSNNKLIAASNIISGGSAVGMGAANSELDVTPTFFIQNVGGG